MPINHSPATAPFFSVVIPTYNRAKFIGRTIESVLAQTFSDFEIIVVDNNSEDETLDVLHAYSTHGCLRFFQNDRNYERAYSRNRGFSLSRGQYVTLLDSDDILYPECLENAFDYATKHPECWFFHCLYEYVDTSYRRLKAAALRPLSDPFRQLMEGNFISNIGVFYGIDVLRRVRFDEDPRLIGVEDYDFVIRVLADTGHIGRIERVLCAIQMHPGRSVLREGLSEVDSRMQHFVAKCLQSPAFAECYKRYVPIFCSNQWLFLSSTAAIRGQTMSALRYWARAISAYGRTIFTRKAWAHMFVILKYALV